jgi:aryl-alcohol dehydrogenase-like predicted oxidoreductase
MDAYVGSTFSLGGDLTVNRLGYGAIHLTGPGYWGPPEDRNGAVRILRRAVELGVNFFDTADSYGPDANEQIIREALYPYADDIVISTKGGMLRSGPMDWSREAPKPYIMPLGKPEYLRQQVEMSLRNLRLDCIDLYQLHSIDPTVPLADQIGVLADMQGEGKIRHIGISNQPQVTIGQLAEAQQTARIAAVECLHHLGDRASEDVLDVAEKQGIAFISFFPLGNGELLTPSSPLTKFATEHGLNPAKVALAWLLRRSPNILCIPGTSSEQHLVDNTSAAEVQLSESDWRTLETICETGTFRRPER